MTNSMESALGKLDKRDAYVLRRFYDLDGTGRLNGPQLAVELHISRGRVYALRDRAVETIVKLLGDKEHVSWEVRERWKAKRKAEMALVKRLEGRRQEDRERSGRRAAAWAAEQERARCWQPTALRAYPVTPQEVALAEKERSKPGVTEEEVVRHVSNQRRKQMGSVATS